MKLLSALLLLASIGLFIYGAWIWETFFMSFGIVLIITSAIIAMSIDALSPDKRSLLEFK